MAITQADYQKIVATNSAAGKSTPTIDVLNGIGLPKTAPSTQTGVPYVSPVVKTSAPATTQVNTAQGIVAQGTTDLQTQAQILAQQKADAALKLKQDQQKLSMGYTANETPTIDAQGNVIAKPAQDKTASVISNYLGGSIADNPRGVISQINADGKTVYLQPDGSFSYSPEGNTPTAGTNADGTSINAYQVEIDKAKAKQAEMEEYKKQAMAGTLPLTETQNAQISALEASYNKLLQQQAVSNANYEGAMTQAGIASGRQRYAPTLEAGNIQTAIKKGFDSIADLTNKKMDALSNMKAGFASANFKLIQDAYNIWSDSEDKITANIKQMNADVAAEKKIVDEAKAQSDKDLAVADLISQGITDTGQILATLKGKGLNITAKEINDSMQAISGNMDVSNFSGETKNFMALKTSGQLPASISKLPEGQQLTAYLQMVRNIETSNAGGSGGGVGGGGYTPGNNAVVDAWAEKIQNGSAKITDIPASMAGLRNQVMVALSSMGNSLDGKPTTTELGKAALANANELMTKFNDRTGTNAVGGSRLWGLGAWRSALPGSSEANFTNDFNAIKSQLSLEGVKYLKGQGQVSDAERALLAQAVTKLNLNQSESEFKKTLQGVIDKLQGNLPTNRFLIDLPDGTTASFNSQEDLNNFKKEAGL